MDTEPMVAEASLSSNDFKLITNKRKRQDETMDMDDEEPMMSEKPSLPPLNLKTTGSHNLSATEIRHVPVPPQRRTPLKDNWQKIIDILVNKLLLDVRYNIRARRVELKNGKETTDVGSLQKGEDFVKAFTLGFEIDDAVALIRLDELYLDSFDVTDVKPLKGDHLTRAIGRVAGKGGKMKFSMENATKTRIVLAGEKVHILGAHRNVETVKAAICNLILGSPPAKVFGNMRALATRYNSSI